MRQALDLLSQLGLVTRTQKLGIACNEPEPDDISRHISSQITVGGFDRHELHEARALFDTKLLGLVVRRMHPADLGVLTEIITSMEGCIEFRGAALKFHRSFWETIFKSCGNRVLQVLATSLLYHNMNHLDAHADEQEDSWYTDMLDMDRSVLSALREEDADRAGALVTNWLAEELAVVSSLWGKTLNMGDGRECSGSVPIPCESPCSLPTPLPSTGLKSGRPTSRLA